ncbi:MAG TPA: carboxypeptidase-like regulatory domain-containing protein [Cyclobacteriaceae bacterium]|nr:carboxypeptidase-like regulatory domain-containing protein [Cyclobacteriaceae bacterium]
MRGILILSLLMFAVLGFSQNASIIGKVIDSKSSEPLPFANVFINNTTHGTATDDNGNFVLKHVPAGEVELVFSFVGYQTYQTKLSISGDQTLKLATIELLVDEKILEQIKVEGKADKEWEANLRRFNNIFIGNSRIAIQAKIVNPWVLDFRRLGDVLLATASEPIIVENEALGYTVTYILSKFTSRKDEYSIFGKVKFEEMKTFDPRIEQRWTENRWQAYRGSQRHFLRSIIENKIRGNGFRMYVEKVTPETRPRTAVFEKELGNSIEPYDTTARRITYDPRTRILTVDFREEKVEVHYLKSISPLKSYEDVNFPVSWLEMKSGLIKTDSTGAFFGPDNTVSSGYMSTLRVGDMLPNDFKPGHTSSLLKQDRQASDLGDMRERVYITTDRAYYYRGDVIWFAGQLHYGNPSRADTLSKVLYVELVDSEKKIIDRKTYFINEGRVKGDFNLPDSLAPGNYFLRAYTNWMRNFGEKFFYLKPVRVLTLLERVLGPHQKVLEKTRGASIVKISSDRAQYAKRGKISIEVDVNEEEQEQEPGPAVFSISVVDEKQAMNCSTETIEQTADDFIDPPDPYAQPVYPIEKGISIRGHFENDKGKGEHTRISVIQGNRQDFANIETNDDGRFWITGFQFNDSMTFALQAKNAKNKVYGKVVVDDQSPAPIERLPPPMLLEIEKSQRNEHYKINDEGIGGKVLEEVVISGTRVNNIKPDYSISRARIDKERFGTLFTLIRSSIPGLTVYASRVGNVIVGDSYAYMIVYRGRNMEPLLMIDGVVQMTEESITNRLNQIQLSNVDHVDFMTYDSRARFGAQAEGGVIMVYTKDGIASTSPVNSQKFNPKLFQSVTLKGYDQASKFRMPDYSNASEDHAQPDFRSTIYWNPNVVTDQTGRANVTFYSADISTSYRIVVEGVTAMGKPFHAEHVIEIR